MTKLRRWLIHKLGGIVLSDVRFKEVVDGYWDEEFFTHSIYIDPSDYKKENAESIEQELASQLGSQILKRGCVFFQGPYKDHDDLRISASCNVLRLHERSSCHYPDHLVFEEDEKDGE